MTKSGKHLIVTVLRNIQTKVLILILTMLLFSAFCGTPHALAAPPLPSEYEVKALYIYNFAKFVEWPNKAFLNTESTINICIIGSNPFENSLEKINNKLITSRRTLIMSDLQAEQLDQCHILFISESEKSRLATILNSLEHFSVLTVGDVEGFAKSGGIINLVMQDNKIGFEINLKAARTAGLNISSQLLKLAIKVYE